MALFGKKEEEAAEKAEKGLRAKFGEKWGGYKEARSKKKEAAAAAEEKEFGRREESLQKRVGRWELEEKEEEFKKKQAARQKKQIRTAVIAIIVIILIAYAFFYLFFTQTGSSGLTGVTGAKTGIFNMFQSSESELNVGIQILKGQYDPSLLWSSQTYQDQYSTQATERGPGIYITRLEPLRDLFPAGSQMIVFGQMEAESIPGEDLSIRIAAESDVTKNADSGSGFYWTCEPNLIENQRVYTGRFQCISSYSLDVAQEGFQEAEQVTVSIDYDFSSVAGKQIYVANSAELDALWATNQNPLVYYGVSADATAPWRTAGPLDVSMAIAGLSEDIIPANDDRNTIASYLMVRVLNRGDGQAVLLNDVTIKVPENVKGLSGLDSDFSVVECEENICTYKAETAGTTIEPGLVEAYYFKFVACDGARIAGGESCPDFLYSAPVSSFFALAELDYNYEASLATTVNAKNIGRSSSSSSSGLETAVNLPFPLSYQMSAEWQCKYPSGSGTAVDEATSRTCEYNYAAGRWEPCDVLETHMDDGAGQTICECEGYSQFVNQCYFETVPISFTGGTSWSPGVPCSLELLDSSKKGTNHIALTKIKCK